MKKERIKNIGKILAEKKKHRRMACPHAELSGIGRFAQSISSDKEIPYTTVHDIIRTFLSHAREELVSGKDVRLVGIGRLRMQNRKERYTHDVSGSASNIYTPSYNRVIFTPDNKLTLDVMENSLVMPTSPVKKGSDFSERVKTLQFYKDYCTLFGTLSK